MTPRDRWLDEGLVVLREQGIAGVRIDRIAARLGLTKGSFHHHFTGVGDYHRSLLDRFEAEVLATIADATHGLADLSPRQVLMEAPDRVSIDAGLEAAIRGWGAHDETARAALGRVDAARLQALVGLWQGIVPDPAQARSAALVPYLIMIGASVAVPTPTTAELVDVFALLANLVDAVPGAASGHPEDSVGAS